MNETLWLLTYKKCMRRHHRVSLMELKRYLTKNNNKNYYVRTVSLYLSKFGMFEVFIVIHCQIIINSLKDLKFLICRPIQILVYHFDLVWVSFDLSFWKYFA